MKATDTLLERVSKMPFFLEAEAAEQQERLDRRREAIEQIATATEAADKKLPKLQAAADAARAKADKLFAEWQAALIEQRQAESANLAANDAIVREIGERQSFLASTASPAIFAYIGELQKLHEHVRHRAAPPVGESGDFFGPNARWDILNSIFKKSRPRADVLSLIASTIELTRQLAFLPLTDEQVQDEIESHRRVIGKAVANLGD